MIIQRTIRRLTLFYSAAMLAVVALFGVAATVYVSLTFDLDIPSTTEEVADHAITTLRAGLGIGFAVLVLTAVPTSYLLARKALAPVQENLEAQRRFVDDASHELRTPIAVAKGELELALLRQRSAHQYQEAIGGALQAIDELAALTDELLFLTRTDRRTLEKETVSMEVLVQRALRSLPPAEQGRVSCQVVGSGSIAGSAELLIRAIGNLLENAVKYAPDSPLELTARRSGASIVISVRDRGPGMSESDRGHALDRFWRADTARGTPGRGIGLSIVQRIVELHGGDVVLRSESGAGTTVLLRFPAASPA